MSLRQTSLRVSAKVRRVTIPIFTPLNSAVARVRYNLFNDTFASRKALVARNTQTARMGGDTRSARRYHFCKLEYFLASRRVHFC